MLKEDSSTSNIHIQPNTSEPLLRAVDVARRLSISRTAAYRLMESGLLPVVRWAGTVRVEPEDLERFVKAKRLAALPGGAGADES